MQITLLVTLVLHILSGVWLREIKHDGFRILARRDNAGVRLILAPETISRLAFR
jgi:hypothetical protein